MEILKHEPTNYFVKFGVALALGIYFILSGGDKTSVQTNLDASMAHSFGVMLVAFGFILVLYAIKSFSRAFLSMEKNQINKEELKHKYMNKLTIASIVFGVCFLINIVIGSAKIWYFGILAGFLFLYMIHCFTATRLLK